MRSLRTLSTALLAVPLFAAPLFTAPLLIAPLLIAPARAQTPGSAASLLEALSLISGGALVAPVLAPEVTQDGDRFHVRIPLPKLTSPPDAAIDATATPLDTGAWDISSLTFPQTGTVVTPGPADQPPETVRFTIGQQTAHARIDPTLTSPSPYAMAFSDIALHIETDASPAELAIGQMTLDGTIMGDAGGRMTTRSHGKADNWHFIVSDKTGAPFTLTLRSANVVYDLDGLDRAKSASLREAAQAVAAARQATPPVPGQPPAMTPLLREQLRAMLDTSAGLMSGMNLEETFQGLHFEARNGNNGDIGEVRFAVASQAADDRIAGHLDIGLNDMTLAAVPPQFVQYVPKRVSIKAAFSGIQAQALRHVLREALDEGADPVALRTQAIALLNEPGAHAGIETLQVESGPLLVEGTARVHPEADGTAGYDIHLTAHGLDAMLAIIQSDPKAQQIMPMLFIAKGMAKPEGDHLVWEIGFAHGVATVNGVPMGHRPGGGESGVRPPVRQ
jgi:hypothetical protein